MIKIITKTDLEKCIYKVRNAGDKERSDDKYNIISTAQCTCCTLLKVIPDFCLGANMKQPVSTL